MSPLESWLFLGLVALILAAAFIGAGRFFDWMLDKTFARALTPEHATPDAEVACPCFTDRDFHRRMGRVWE